MEAYEPTTQQAGGPFYIGIDFHLTLQRLLRHRRQEHGSGARA